MERLMEYVRTKKQEMDIFEILAIIGEEQEAFAEVDYDDLAETMILTSKYRNYIYDYQRVFDEMFRGMDLAFNLNWDNFVDLAIGNVIEEMLTKWTGESQYFRLDKKEIEIIRELVKYQFYQSIQCEKGRSKAEMERYFQKKKGAIRNMASFLTGLERSYCALVRIVRER